MLSEVSLIAAEDTRVTRKLLARHGIDTPLISFHAHTRPDRLSALVERLDSGDIALVSDAGTPIISDPGAALVSGARAHGHCIVAVPGPSAVAAALSVSGLPANRYTFIGFLPRRSSERRQALQAVAGIQMTVVAFETPHRLLAALEDMLATLGDREICVARELTKIFEENWHGRISEAIERWTDVAPKGEFTLVIAGAAAPASTVWEDADILRALEQMRSEGMSAREASRALAAKSDRSAREIYSFLHRVPAADNAEEEGRDPATSGENA